MRAGKIRLEVHRRAMIQHVKSFACFLSRKNALSRKRISANDRWGGKFLSADFADSRRLRFENEGIP
jgi:hypothetical protein